MRQCLGREEARDAILDACGRLLERYGYRKMTVDDIAHEAGVGKGTVYLHFQSKEEVALSWIARGSKQLHARLAAIARSPGPPERRLREMLIARVLFRFDALQGMRESIDELCSTIRASLLAQREQYHKEEARIFADVVREGHACGVFAQRDPTEVGRSLLLATNSLLPYSLSVSQLGARAEIDAKVRALADLLLTGLLARALPEEHRDAQATLGHDGSIETHGLRGGIG